MFACKNVVKLAWTTPTGNAPAVKKLSILGGASTFCGLVYHVSLLSSGFELGTRTPLRSRAFIAVLCRRWRCVSDSTFATGVDCWERIQRSMSSGLKSSFRLNPVIGFGKSPIPLRLSEISRRSVDSLTGMSDRRFWNVSGFFIVVSPCVFYPGTKKVCGTYFCCSGYRLTKFLTTPDEQSVHPMGNLPRQNGQKERKCLNNRQMRGKRVTLIVKKLGNGKVNVLPF